MARKPREDRVGDDEHRVDERWLVTYADMITCLLIFFITMYALSSRISREKFENMKKSLAPTYSKKKLDIAEKDKIPGDTPFKKGEISDQIKTAIAPFKGKSQVKVGVIGDKVLIALQDTSFFDLGSTTLKEEAREPLRAIARSLATASREITVEGHTDAVRAGYVSSASANTNWVIAATRAANVADFLAREGNIPPERFHLISYAEVRPLYPNDTPEHRAMNRRVDIVVHNKPLPATPTPGPSPTEDSLAPALGASPTSMFGNPNQAPAPNGGGMTNPFGNNF